MTKRPKPKAPHSAEAVKAFFAHSDYLDRMVLRPLSHITTNWEAHWDGEEYAPEHDSFAADLTATIDLIAKSPRPLRYHDNEDELAKRVIEDLKWPIQKKKGRWEGADYPSILEQGAFKDFEQKNLLSSAAGRVHAALDFGQKHFDEMEDGHMVMLSAVMTIIIYHRYSEGSSLIQQGDNPEDL